LRTFKQKRQKAEKSEASDRTQPRISGNAGASSTLQWQRLLGNRAVSRLLHSSDANPVIQRQAPPVGLGDFENFQEHLGNQRFAEALDLLKKQDAKTILRWLSQLSIRELAILMSGALDPRLMSLVNLVYYGRFEPDLDTIKIILDGLAALPAGDRGGIEDFLRKGTSPGLVRIRVLYAVGAQFWSSRASFLNKIRGEFPALEERRQIEGGLLAVTGDNLPLWTAYYTAYSSASLEKAVGKKAADMKALGRAGETAGSTTWIRPEYLASPHTQAELGAILIHEFVHLRHPRGFAGGENFEGEAYGVDYFLAERSGDVQRAATVYNAVAAKPQGDVNTFQREFKRSYGVMKVLYEIVDGKPSSAPATVLTANPPTPGEARDFVVEFIRGGVGVLSDRRLKNIVQWVENNRVGFIPRQNWPATGAWTEPAFVGRQ